MTERPILFSGPMVRAILEGTKTQTRRVMKPQPSWDAAGGGWYPPNGTSQSAEMQPPRARHYANAAHVNRGLAIDFSPYGQPGDRLWVLETWAPILICGNSCDVAYAAHGQEPDANTARRVTLTDEELEQAWRFLRHGKWCPSIHMPRWASRIALEVTEVHVQCLQEISEEDAEAEGCPGFSSAGHPAGDDGMSPEQEFRVLWDSINGERPGCSWEDNPWVWCIAFRRLP
jgi:hypothetical protein